ncbi:apolipoprotein N-acyltransferase [Sphingopyxis sp. OPL5]|uniref:apolipoprotein N-acyltransferase n=1 Tax=Sphingopyxis sp. OPL5 TaxID=2486273 RepID=UPI00164D1603|nr:apolipoprotein N-acyltransferase [Sphingopyxis sp. OPL5]QNO28858.1 apolipoprotein N-acyltransferase [Sphingopyxis sp. OPL5]
MTALSPRIAAFADRWPKLIALLLGAVSATGFAPLHFWPLTLVALAGWMALVARSPKGRRALGIGWAFGAGHFTIGLNWIATAFTYQAAMPAWLGWIAVLLLALYLAVYPALAAWGAWMVARFKGRSGTAASLSFILAFAALWTLTEWLRSWVFTGFAWNPLSVVMLRDFFGPAVIRWIGTYGASGILVAQIGAMIWLWQYLHRPDHPTLAGRPFAQFFVWWLAVGVLNAPLALLDKASRSDDYVRGIPGNATSITVVQPNVGQEDKWVGTKADANFAKLARLTAPKNDTPRLILWPEAAVPDYLETGYPLVYYDRSPAEARGRLVALMNPDDVMLLGALKLELDRTGEVVGARNAVMTVHADGTLGPRYDKSHLVPYGEYLPMRPILSAIGLSRLAPGDIDFWPGPGPHTLDLGRFGKVGLQVCYEIIFSGQVVDRDHRPAFLFNPSNDAWFGSWGPPQHLAQARLRAIEEGLPVVRSTPTGISAVIDADGWVRESIPMHQAGRIDTMLPPAHAPTLFARYGNILPVGFALLLLAAAIAFRRRGR